MRKFLLLILSGVIISYMGNTQVLSDFEIDSENWHSEGDGSYFWEATTGNPGGCLRVDDDATGAMNRAYAPVEFLGDWSSATITDYVSADIFSYDMGGGFVNGNFVFRIEGPGGSAIAFDNPTPQPPHDTWTNYTVTLDETNWTIESGTWSAILDHVTSFVVTMEYIGGDEYCRLDNVVLSINPVPVPVAPGLCSDFENGLFGGWSTIESTKNIISTGGNPGKYLQVNDGTGTSLAVPPSIYHGDWSALDNHNAEIHLDIKVSEIDGTTYLHDFFVKISGPGGEATYPLDNSIENAFNKWHSFGIPIEQTGWTIVSGDWSSLMDFVDGIQVIAEFITGDEVVGIDNFCISDSPPVTDFMAEKTFVYLGETVQFFDQTTSAPQTWSWDFGDAGISTEVNPTHLYSSPGTYTVTLSTSNYYGNSSETKTLYIEVFPVDQCLKFEDDFEDGVLHPGWSFVNGTWSESSGNLRQTSNHYVGNNYLGGCFALAGSTSWEDYIVSCDFQSTDNDEIGFVFNYQDEQNMYLFRWGLQESERRLSKYVDGVETVLASEDFGYVEDDWYHADIYSVSGTLVIAIDEVEIFAVNDNTFTSGLAGPYCWGNQSSYYDNFTVECAGTPVELSVFLEGPTIGSTMNTDLQSENVLSLTNPYTPSPWNHSGNEGVLSFSNSDIVDWILVDFRDATSGANAIPSASVVTKSGLLLKDGQIISPYGGLPIYLNEEISDDLFVVIYHRNHLGIMTANPLIESGGSYTYDFTTSANQAYGTNAQKDLGNSIFGMFAGDINVDGIVDELDKDLLWSNDAGKAGYLSSDCNFDGQADNMDKNDYWLNNIDKSSKIPE